MFIPKLSEHGVACPTRVAKNWLILGMVKGGWNSDETGSFRQINDGPALRHFDSANHMR